MGTLHIAFGCLRAQPPPRHCLSKNNDRAQKAQTRIPSRDAHRRIRFKNTFHIRQYFHNSQFPKQCLHISSWRRFLIFLRRETFASDKNHPRHSAFHAVVVPSPGVTEAENLSEEQEVGAAQPIWGGAGHGPGATAPRGGQGPHPRLHCCILTTRFLRAQVELKPHRAELCYLQIMSFSNGNKLCWIQNNTKLKTQQQWQISLALIGFVHTPLPRQKWNLS